MKLFYSLFLVFLLVSAGRSQNSKDLITAMARTEKSADVIRQFAALSSADSVPAEYFQKATAQTLCKSRQSHKKAIKCPRWKAPFK